MIVASWWWENLLSYGIQVGLLVGAAAVLQVVFRLKTPRWQLVYWHVLLLACLALPLAQPWRADVITAEPEPIATATAHAPIIRVSHTYSTLAVRDWAAIALAAGALFRLSWLLLGMSRLRRYRNDAILLLPVPKSAFAAMESTGAKALFCVSDDIGGPVTFGFTNPVILLPSHVLDLSYEAQYAIACHELLHVRRNDWLCSLAEEIVGSILWFHPAIWWTVGQIRLSREQVVDQQVVSLTRAREPYVNALLSMAGASPAELAPAPLFLRKHHLTQRVYSLLKEVTVSKRRLILSYLSVTALLAATGWVSFTAFPLKGQPQLRESTRPDSAGVTVQPGAALLHRSPVRYPSDALDKNIEGAVLVEASVNSRGIVTDAHVISGPEELRKAALESVLTWHYAESAGGKVQVSVEFKITPEMKQAAATRSEHESARATPAPRTSLPTPQVLRTINLSNLPETLQNTLRARMSRFEGQPMSNALMDEIRAAGREVDPHLQYAWQQTPGTSDYTAAILLEPGAGSEAPVPQAAPAFPSTPGVKQIRVGGNVQSQKLISKTTPLYPQLAKEARIQGTVRFNVLINKDGYIQNIQLVSGHPLLVTAAQEAVRQWVYQTTLLNGEPAEVITTIDVNFTLSE